MTSHAIFRAMTVAGLMAASHIAFAFTPAPDKPSEKVTLIEIGDLYQQGSSGPSNHGFVFRADDPVPEDMFMVWRYFETKEVTSDEAAPRKGILAHIVANTGNDLSTIDLALWPAKGKSQLEVGKYQSHLIGYSQDPSAPQLNVSGWGNTYFADLGRYDADFEIVELIRGAGGEITSFAANFVLTNALFPRNPTPYTVTGRFWYNSDALNVISVPEPQAVILMLTGLAVAGFSQARRGRSASSQVAQS